MSTVGFFLRRYRMIYCLTITLFLSIFTIPIINATEKSIVVSPQPDSDSLILTFGKIKSLKDAVYLAATDKYHYNTFYDAIRNNNSIFQPSINKHSIFKPSFLFVEKNYHLCTKMLLSCAALYEDAEKRENKIDKKKYKQRFHSLWRYSSHERDSAVIKIIGDPYFTKSSDFAKQIKISLYAGVCVNEHILERALSVYLDEKECDILQSLIVRNPERSHFINKIYTRLGMNVAKKIIDFGIELKAYHHDNIPVGQSLISSAYHKNDQEMIEFLLDKGVRNTIDFERSFEHGGILNIFSNSVTYLHINIVKLFLQRDYFDQATKNKLFQKSVDYNKPSLFELLLEHGADKSSLTLPVLCLKGYIDELRSLIQKDSTIFKKLSKWDICDCFKNALELNNHELLEFLCTQQGVNINKGFENDRGILYFALKEKKFDAAKIFLKHGADIQDKYIEMIYERNQWDQETVDFLVKNAFNTTELKKQKIERFLNEMRDLIFFSALGTGLSVIAVCLVFLGIGLEGAGKEIWKTIVEVQ